ncbi:hypothetical protein [Streptomyces sp. NPDC050560]|uniref:hypothetical protein n=1 Tax=Streptomyces sp. NPDC050560 TaxID=3365630 RepID=UPI00379C95D4
MSAEETAGQERPSLLRRIRKALDEFTPPPEPHPTPGKKEFAEGREAVGIIRYAVPNDSPEGGLTDDDLVIHIDASDDGRPLTLPRTVMCPLPGPCAGRRLIGKKVVVRHTTVDPDYDNDILVTRWPQEVQEALKPIRYAGPGAVRARIWGILSACFFVIGYAGVMLTPLLLCDLIFGSLAGQRVLAEILPQVHPVIALVVSVGVIPAGVFVGCSCATRRDTLLGGERKEKTLTSNARS